MTSLGRRQELMKIELDRNDRSGKPMSSRRFRRPNTYPLDKIHLKSFTMGRKVWEMMGSPETITVTVEVGDVRDVK